MMERKKGKGMLMSAVLVAVAVAGGILLAGVVKKNLLKDSAAETEEV